MAGRPSLLDNLHPDTGHGDGLVYLTRELDDRHALSVATGFVNLGGLRHLAVSVSEGRATRLLLGAAPSAGLGSQFPATLFERTLLALRKERDLSRFPASRELKNLLAIKDWLDRPNVEVRRYVKKFLHGKAYLFGNEEDAQAALVTSANLTAAGMWQNLELGLVHYDPGDREKRRQVVRCAVGQCERLQGRSLRTSLPRHRAPRPSNGLSARPSGILRGRTGARGGTSSGRESGSVSGGRISTGLSASSIGIAALCTPTGSAPARPKSDWLLWRSMRFAVASTRWSWFLPSSSTNGDHDSTRRGCLRRSSAITASPPTNSSRIPKSGTSIEFFQTTRMPNRLIIFDEAHALRNPGTTWYGAMSRLLGGQEKDLLLLTATPINNGLWDLYHMVMAFARHDRAFAPQGIRSLRHLFLNAGANERDPESLNPDVLFPLADMVSVRRDRRFIESRYPRRHVSRRHAGGVPPHPTSPPNGMTSTSRIRILWSKSRKEWKRSRWRGTARVITTAICRKNPARQL